MLKYHFSKIGPDGWKEMVEAAQKGVDTTDPYHDRAWALFVESYDLPEFRRSRMHSLARTDLKAALDARRVPNWVLNRLTGQELKEIKGVKK